MDMITVKNNSSQYRLFLSADASLPLIYLTDKNKQSPLTAPGFCMLLNCLPGRTSLTELTIPEICLMLSTIVSSCL